MNEDLSKIQFQRALRNLKPRCHFPITLDEDLVLTIIDLTKVSSHLSPATEELIGFTEFSGAGKEEIRRVLDCDLAGLAASWPIFVENQYNIIFEYAGPLDDVQLNHGRRASATFLKAFLDKPRIYLTDEAHAAHEAAARSNIQRWADQNP